MGRFSLITEEYEEFKQLFAIPECCEQFMIFDLEGDLLVNENIYIESYKVVRNLLNKKLKGIDYSITKYLPANSNIRNYKWLEQISAIQQSRDEEYYLISMFIEICSGCSSGSIMERLKKTHLEKKEFIYHLAFVPKSFTENDINNLKSEFNLRFTIVNADEQFNNKWNQLIEEYGQSNLTNIVFLIDKAGTVLRTMDGNCSCIEEFFSHIKSL